MDEDAEKDHLVAVAEKATKEWEEQNAKLEWVNPEVHAVFSIQYSASVLTTDLCKDAGSGYVP